MFPTINKKETGVNLRRIMDMRGVKPKDIQEYLGFGCVQSVYRWLDGVSMVKVLSQLTEEYPHGCNVGKYLMVESWRKLWLHFKLGMI